MTRPIEPWHLTASECARWIGIARNTFADRGYAPALQIGCKKYFDIREIFIESVRAGIVSSGGDDGDIDLNYQRARLVQAQAGLAEISLAAEEGRLCPVEEVETAIIATLTPVVAMLDSLPLTIKRDCPELSHTAVERIERTIATARNNLADEEVMTPAEAA